METIFKLKVSIVLRFYFKIWKQKTELLARHTIYLCDTAFEV
jgi:hypothetical protein